MKKNVSIVLLLLVIIAFSFSNKKINASEINKVPVNQEFEITEDGYIFNGIIIIEDDLNITSLSDIKMFYKGKINGKITCNNGGIETSKNIDSNVTIGRKSVNSYVFTAIFNFFDFEREVLKDFQFIVNIWDDEYINSLPDKSTIPPKEANVSYNTPKLLINSYSSKSIDTRIQIIINSEMIETNEFDEDGEAILVGYISFVDDLIKNSILLTNSSGEQLTISGIEYSKNITNLKYGKRNACAYIYILDGNYDIKTVPLSITYFPSLELDYTTRHTAKLLPINGALYSIDGEAWQESSKFKGLEANTEYTISVKAKNDITGDTIQTIMVTTED